MIISRGRRYIFVHIPKTGGTALTMALEARALRDDILIGDTPKAKARRRRLVGATSAGRLWKHSTLADIDGLVTTNEIADFFTFTLVRNPWDRMVSLYHFLRGQSFSHPMVQISQTHDFSGFLNSTTTKTAVLGAPYTSYMRGRDGRCHATLYARIEALAEDIAPLETHLGFRLAPLAQVNQSQRPRDWRGLYSDADAALVQQLCATDIASFDYRFDP